ncbi:MAG: 3-oxoacyl-ACP synthase, partial [Anaerolineales bacterium]|nr:3-oxoacyl-ACP synthase [Anaerolineales bacterium]
MQRKYGKIVGWGKYAPERVLTNAEIETFVDTTDEWITRRTGIKQRHIAADHETTSSMAIEASRRALAMAGMTPADLDL